MALTPMDDIRAARLQAGLSQQKVAELAGCSLSAVRLMESGYRPQSGTSPTQVQILAVIDARLDAGN